MTRLAGLFQNRLFVTALVFVVLALMVAHKTVHTKPFQDDGFQGVVATVIAMDSLKLAQELTQGKPPNPDNKNAEFYASGAGYPVVIATLASVDPNLKRALNCHNREVACNADAFTNLFALQYGVALLGLVAIFLLAWVLSRSWSVALLALALAFIAGSYGGLAGQLSPVVWQQTMMLSFLLFIALAATRDDIRWTLAAGFTFGIAALFQPQLAGVAPIAALSFWLLGKSQHSNLKHPYAHILTFVIGMVLTPALLFTSPWSVDLGPAVKQNLAGQVSERVALSTAGFPSWIGYLMATPGIFMRGLWVGTPILTVLGFIHLPALLRFSREDARLEPTLLIAIPILALVIVNTLVTANQPDYNVGLVFLLTYATAYLVGRTDIRRKFWEDQERTKGMAVSN